MNNFKKGCACACVCVLSNIEVRSKNECLISEKYFSGQKKRPRVHFLNSLQSGSRDIHRSREIN